MLLASLAAGCGGCSHGPARNAEEFVDADAPLIVSVPSLGTLADHVDGLRSTARAAGNDVVVEWLASLAGDGALGFDIFTRAGQKAAGLDPDRSLAIGGSPSKGACVAIPYSNLDKLLTTLRHLGPEKTGATVVEKRKVGATPITVFAKSAGGDAVFAYAAQDDYLLVAMGEGPVEAVAAAATRKKEASAAAPGAFANAKTRVGARDVYLFVPKVPPGAYRFLPSAITAGLVVSADEIALRGYFPVGEGRADALSHVLVSGSTPMAELPADQPLYLRGGVDWSSVVRTLAGSAPASGAIQTLAAACQKAGLDFEKDLVGNLEPGFALSLGLAPTARLATMTNLDPTRQNPFENYSLVVLGHVKDAAKAQSVFAKLPPAIQAFGATITTRDLGGKPAYTANYQLGQGLSWMLRGNELVAAGGVAERLDSILSGGAGAPVTKAQFSAHASDALFSETGLAVALDLSRLREALKRTPSGFGPGAFMAAMIQGKLNDVAHFRPVLSVTPSDGGMVVDFATNVK
jgi:hypothetical protein